MENQTKWLKSISNSFTNNTYSNLTDISGERQHQTSISATPTPTPIYSRKKELSEQKKQMVSPIYQESGANTTLNKKTSDG